MDDVPEPIRNAAYALVGLTVVWVQRGQVLRRELARELPVVGGQLAGAAKEVAGAVRSVLEGTTPPPPAH